MRTFIAMLALLGVVLSACGGDGGDAAVDRGEAPAAIAFSDEGDELFSVQCDELRDYVLATPDLAPEQSQTQATDLLAGTDAELRAELDTYYDLSARYGNLPDTEVATLFASFEKFDRGTHRACRVPVFSAPTFMERQVFCITDHGIEVDDDSFGAGASSASPGDGGCEDPRATSVPCFAEVSSPGRIVPFTYHPIDCDSGRQVQLADDGSWFELGSTAGP